MLVDPNQTTDRFEEIIQKYRTFQTSVIILAACDCDSLATAKILVVIRQKKKTTKKIIFLCFFLFVQRPQSKKTKTQ